MSTSNLQSFLTAAVEARGVADAADAADAAGLAFRVAHISVVTDLMPIGGSAAAFVEIDWLDGLNDRIEQIKTLQGINK